MRSPVLVHTSGLKRIPGLKKTIGTVLLAALLGACQDARQASDSPDSLDPAAIIAPEAINAESTVDLAADTELIDETLPETSDAVADTAAVDQAPTLSSQETASKDNESNEVGPDGLGLKQMAGQDVAGLQQEVTSLEDSLQNSEAQNQALMERLRQLEAQLEEMERLREQ